VRFGVAKYALLAFIAVVLTGWTLALAGCGDDDDDGDGGGADESAALQEVGKGEGQVDLIAWSGYVEDGSTDPAYDWVTPFEKKTGCDVNVKIGNTSDEMVTLMRTGNYDGVSASGDATLRLVQGGDVDPVNVDLVPNYQDIFPALKDQTWNTVDGVHYGIPHGRGANLLMWNTDNVSGNQDSWSAVFPGDQYKGKVTAYDSPIYIADAAVYMRDAQPELGIDNPYELDEDQFNAAVDLLKQQRENIGEYWFAYTEEQNGFANGDIDIGQSWQYTANLLTDADVPVKTVLPKEGATGWSDTWMISSEAKHPNCTYMWLDWVVSPKVNAQIAEYFGEAPANSKSCALTVQKDFCDVYHADDEKFFDQIEYWNTPTADCGDDRGDVCKDYSEWVQAWTEIKG
jgi:putative spermidine/putrescine transport system substrate-binding protein